MHTGPGAVAVVNASAGTDETSMGRSSRKGGEQMISHRSPDGTEELDAWECAPGCCVAALDAQSGELTSGRLDRAGIMAENKTYGARPKNLSGVYEQDSGGASRFFPSFSPDDPGFLYTAKAAKSERNLGGANNKHPTVKPLELMSWLTRLITPPGGIVLDPFAGSGSTLVAALRQGFRAIGIEREPEYVAIARHRIEEDAPLMRRPRPTLTQPVSEADIPKLQQGSLFDMVAKKADH